MRVRLLLSLAACLLAHAAEPVFFVQLADTQLGMYSQDADSSQEQANLAFVAASINRLKPRFVVVCGDLVNRPGDPEQIRAYLQIMRTVRAGIPVYNVAGNHDVSNEPSPTTLASYRRSFGKDYYSFDAGDIRGIVLNSSLIKAPGAVPGEAEAQEKWLAGELERARREKLPHVFVFQHIPYFIEDPQEPEEYGNLPLAARKRYLERFQQYGVEYVFAGHMHRNAGGRDGAVNVVITGPAGKPLGKDQSGLRVVRVAGSTVESRYYEFGSIPNEIKADAELPASVR